MFQRQITRRTRKWLYLHELLQTYSRLSWRQSKRGVIDFLFRVYVLFSDINDIAHYLHYIKLLDNPKLQIELRTLNANFYFLECVVWLLLNIHDYMHAGDDVKRRNEKLLYIVKYILDVLVSSHSTQISHNDFSRSLFKLDPKLTSIMGLLSSLLSLYIAWK